MPDGCRQQTTGRCPVSRSGVGSARCGSNPRDLRPGWVHNVPHCEILHRRGSDAPARRRNATARGKSNVDADVLTGPLRFLSGDTREPDEHGVPRQGHFGPRVTHGRQRRQRPPPRNPQSFGTAHARPPVRRMRGIDTLRTGGTAPPVEFNVIGVRLAGARQGFASPASSAT